VVLILAILYVPVALMTPYIVGAVLIAAGVLVYRRRWLRLPRLEDWTHVHARVLTLALVFVVVTFALVSVAVSPPPLDTVTIRLESGALRSGGFLATANDSIYVVEHPRPGASGVIAVFPVDGVRAARISEGTPRRYRSLANRLGLTDEAWSAEDFSCRAFPRWVRGICEAGE
jgi:hypothetical protein